MKYTGLLLVGLLMANASWASPTWVQKPNFGELSVDTLYENKHCYDIDMAYFNDCEAGVTLTPQLFIDKQGNITAVHNVNTGDRGLDRQIITALKKGRLAPFVVGGVPVSGRATLGLAFEGMTKKPMNAQNAEMMRQICANDDDCDDEQLKEALKTKGF
ncbi:Uncharacterised protein [Moraxella caprae]|uniref:Uncharacterized protein n=1 Tax=Moraxella caprae TaxID=90240 RepID=A0A378R2S0_9GAMM|nr:hypothetical protein [Moraxella caprae]STZ09643.1 Uncharacterised protein [Moraxella caprae]